MAMGDKETIRVSIKGRVQGVWFRAWTTKMAGKFGLAGWVRNRADGSVEALFQGGAQDILDMIEACKKGPPAARVDAVDVEYLRTEDHGALDGFRQRPTI